ncbi:hypothetical protein [Pelagicoccus sp. SDUM812005]|uniref:hypothetical protein n=1 Tax=Pelagicoccus sp. SDUM812005 TaxID=3041257 RepID=UPI00280E5213|nr:hypothetical protein [Pelagicoccus sp. SDUM812005]MDQ8181074.1 hypothetical protein [Pelagicoccus sp. SDUM812005]
MFLVLGTVIGLLGAVDLASAYLVALCFWIQVSGGCLALSLIWGVGGGRWGQLFAKEMAASRWTWLPLLALLVPVLLWSGALYGLEDSEVWGWGARSVAYLGVLAVLAWVAGRRADARWRWSGPGLVVVALVFSLIAVDWMMSLTPHFHSSIFPFIWFSDSMLGALAWLAFWRMGGDPQGSEVARYQFGKLLFAAVFFWGYIAVSQWIIVWSADLPSEARWYLDRTSGAWLGVTLAVALLRFALPFALLLSASLKRSARTSAWVGGLVLLSQFMAAGWMVLPSLEGGAGEFGLALLLAIGMGGIWSCAWLYGRWAQTRKEAGAS